MEQIMSETENKTEETETELVDRSTIIEEIRAGGWREQVAAIKLCEDTIILETIKAQEEAREPVRASIVDAVTERLAALDSDSPTPLEGVDSRERAEGEADEASDEVVAEAESNAGTAPSGVVFAREVVKQDEVKVTAILSRDRVVRYGNRSYNLVPGKDILVHIEAAEHFVARKLVTLAK